MLQELKIKLAKIRIKLGQVFENEKIAKII